MKIFSYSKKLKATNLIQPIFIEEGLKSKKAIEEGENFLAENGKKKGVTTLESGLQYEVITKGEGAKPTLNDQVTTHYHGTLIDGTVFDSSVDRKRKVSFPLNRVIKGWTEGLQLIKEGGKIKLVIPAELGYGEHGAPPKIPACFNH